MNGRSRLLFFPCFHLAADDVRETAEVLRVIEAALEAAQPSDRS